MPDITVGQIGLGNMGGQLAQLLIDEGFEVLGFDIDDDAIESFEEYGGEAVGSNKELAERSNIVLSALSYPAVIREALLGEDGVAAGAHEDLVCIEQSTVPPEPTREIAADMEAAGVTFLDAPFLGSPHSAREGTLILPVGGDRDVYDRTDVQAVLDAASSESYYMGDVGAGKATKLVNNCISLGNSVLAYEALAMGQALGLEVGQLHEALSHGAGSSVALRVFIPAALNQEFPPVFPVSYTQKDIGYALDAAQDVDFPMFVASTILQLYTGAAAKGHADEAASTVVKVFEDWLGEQLEAEEPVEVPDHDPIFDA